MKKSILAIGFFAFMLASCGGNSTDTKTGAAAGSSEKDAGIPKPKAPAATGNPRILFVGNSHTEFYVSIPKMFAELCAFNNTKIEEEELVEMGISIEEIYNADKDKAEKMFAKTDADGNYYDYIILQEKTPVALQELDKYKASVKMLVDKIKKNSPGVAVYIYEVMSPESYAENKDQFNEYHKEMKKNALAVIGENPNSGLFRVADAIKDAYDGQSGYQYKVNGKDNLRFGTNTLHMLNDGGFMASTMLYAMLFDKKPNVPEEMTFSAGTGDNDGQKKMKVSTAVSNPSALLEIAYKDR